MFWTPDKRWLGQDTYVIGGGPSLEGFNWDLLLGKNTIGCNSAFRLGNRVCQVCFFGDRKWFEQYQMDLQDYAGLVVTSLPHMEDHHPEWVRVCKRENRGLHTDALGWGCSGVAATNLALLFGAKRVFLLGFDMRLGSTGKTNWHEYVIDPPKPEVYTRFISGFNKIAGQLGSVFPGTEIINVTDGSNLKCFPTVSVAEHFQGFVL
jgi:hypothetical protein